MPLFRPARPLGFPARRLQLVCSTRQEVLSGKSYLTSGALFRQSRVQSNPYEGQEEKRQAWPARPEGK